MNISDQQPVTAVKKGHSVFAAAAANAGANARVITDNRITDLAPKPAVGMPIQLAKKHKKRGGNKGKNKNRDKPVFGYPHVTKAESYFSGTERTPVEEVSPDKLKDLLRETALHSRGALGRNARATLKMDRINIGAGIHRGGLGGAEGRADENPHITATASGAHPLKPGKRLVQPQHYRIGASAGAGITHITPNMPHVQEHIDEEYMKPGPVNPIPEQLQDEYAEVLHHQSGRIRAKFVQNMKKKKDHETEEEVLKKTLKAIGHSDPQIKAWLKKNK